jgi:hypothetical protein
MRIAMMAITTSSSISVNAGRAFARGRTIGQLLALGTCRTCLRGSGGSAAPAGLIPAVYRRLVPINM